MNRRKSFVYFTNNGNNLLISNIFSIILHPLLMPSYLFATLFYYTPNLIPFYKDTTFSSLIEIAILTFVIPASAIILLFVSGIISSLSIPRQQERIIPSLVISLIYTAIGYVFIQYINVDRLFILIICSIAISVIISSFITFFYKISIHMVGIGGYIGIICAFIYNLKTFNLLIPLLCSILVAGFLASSRLNLNAHTNFQITWGFVLGILINIAILSNFY